MFVLTCALLIGTSQRVCALSPGDPIREANATISATVLPPLLMSKIADLDYGTVSVGAGGGTVKLTPLGDCIAEGDLSLLNTTQPSAARFIIEGHPDASISVFLPSGVTLVNSDGTASIEVSEFESDLNDFPQLDSEGVTELHIGATLQLASQQATGEYSGAFEVTIAYH